MRLLKSFYHFILAFLGSVIYKHPSQKLFVIGVTGTKGKSTVIELINSILETAGKKTALMSSVHFKIGDESQANLTGMTMPGRFAVQKFLDEAVKKGCNYAIIEVTSQGIVQYRHRFIDFGAAIVTNLEAEHIEAHGSFEKYRNSKIKFFADVASRSKRNNKFFFINSGARYNAMFSDATKGKGKIIFYNKKDIASLKIKSKLIGDFNLENIAAAIAFSRSRNIDWDIIREATEAFDGVPGRLEFIQKVPFSVVIDYAHTPDSLEKIYNTLSFSMTGRGRKNNKKKGNLICVLGSAGGGRDIWKRPVMGRIASTYCDKVFLTNEDPFNEDPNQILNEIESGVNENDRPKFKKVLDREEAIRMAIKQAHKGDTVIITGKGCEPYMRISKGKRIPWNEKEVTLKILNSERIEL